ncbi:hypothetical protein [Nostoc parmelioides]
MNCKHKNLVWFYDMETSLIHTFPSL